MNHVLTDVGENVARWRECNIMHPSTIRTGELSTDSPKRQPVTPYRGLRSVHHSAHIANLSCVRTHLASTPLMNAEKTYALASAAPAARSTLLGCQSMARTVDRSGFFTCFDTHQLFSSSNEHTAMILKTINTCAPTQSVVLRPTLHHSQRQTCPRLDSI